MRRLTAPPVTWVLASLLLLVLLLPVLAPFIVRLDENRLLRETEENLLAEAAVVAELYRALAEPAWRDARLAEPALEAGRFRPVRPSLDLRKTPVLGPAERAPGPGEVATSSITRLLEGVLERAQVRTLSGVRVLDTRGVVLASSSRERGYSLLHLEEVRAALAGQYAPVLRERLRDRPPLRGSSSSRSDDSLERAADFRVSLAIPIYADPRAASGPVIGAVYASRTPLGLEQSWWRLRRVLVVPVTASLGVLALVLLFLTRVIAAPLVRLTRAAEAVAHGTPGVDLSGQGLAPREIHDLAAALARMREQLERRAEYVRVFAAQTVHELKSPLTSLRGAAELLLDAEGAMPPAQSRRFVGQIHDDAVRMDGLVGRILQLARIESSAPDRRPVAPRALVEGVVERYTRRDRAVSLSWSAADDVLALDVEQLDSLLSNLLDNALRHGEGRRVEVRARDEAGQLVLEVVDDGPPLPAAHFERIFERYYTTERHKGGTGLGLAIVRAVAEAHGGEVRAAHGPGGRGASFVVRLPRAGRGVVLATQSPT
jgi:two-component system sensor histidine kinase CreC